MFLNYNCAHGMCCGLPYTHTHILYGVRLVANVTGAAILGSGGVTVVVVALFITSPTVREGLTLCSLHSEKGVKTLCSLHSEKGVNPLLTVIHTDTYMPQ